MSAHFAVVCLLVQTPLQIMKRTLLDSGAHNCKNFIRSHADPPDDCCCYVVLTACVIIMHIPRAKAHFGDAAVQTPHQKRAKGFELRRSQEDNNDSCGVRTHALTDQRLKLAP